LLLAEPTNNRTPRAALAWRARILSQKALSTYHPFRPTEGFLSSDEPRENPNGERVAVRGLPAL
jgi:hypothetical protein